MTANCGVRRKTRRGSQFTPPAAGGSGDRYKSGKCCRIYVTETYACPACDRSENRSGEPFTDPTQVEAHIEGAHDAAHDIDPEATEIPTSKAPPADGTGDGEGAKSPPAYPGPDAGDEETELPDSLTTEPSEPEPETKTELDTDETATDDQADEDDSGGGVLMLLLVVAVLAFLSSRAGGSRQQQPNLM